MHSAVSEGVMVSSLPEKPMSSARGMFYPADMTQHNESGLRHDSDTAYHDTPITPPGHRDLRVTVESAAQLLDITKDAVHKRIEQGTLQSDKNRYVVLDTDMIRHDDVRSTVSDNHVVDMTHIVANLEEQVAFLREVIRSWNRELRRREEEYREKSHRKDHLLAAALERIPEIEPASEPREDPETASASIEGVRNPLEAQKPPWWRRLFGS